MRGVKNREIMMVGSCTWAQQAVKVMSGYLESLKAVCVTEPVLIKQAPTSEQLEQCREAATALARKLTATEG